MGGTSSSTQQQSSTTAPWQPAQSGLTGILGQLNGYTGQTGINSTQTGALNTIEQNGANTGQYAPAVQGYTQNLLNGGGATDQAGNINSAYQQYQQQTNPLASNTNYNPMNTPGFSDALNTQISDITNGVNGQFAAAGRDGSPANSMALGRGISQGIAPTIAAQYNQNVQNQQGAAGNLYNAGNTTGGLLTGLQQQGLANQGQGVSSIGAGQDALNSGANNTLTAESQRLGIPLQNLGMLSSLFGGIGSLGSQSSGTSTGTQQMSGAQQFGTIMQGIGSLGNLWPKSSDRRLKEDIEQVGALFDGTPVYGYRYIGAPTYHIGLMAQDVEKTTPGAVVEINGYKAVDYHVATEPARKWGKK